MHTFYEFWRFLEDYKSVDPEEEREKAQELNLTSGLPLPKGGDILQAIGDLTRGFHLNTIIGRMLQPWTVGLKFAPIRWDLVQYDDDDWQIANPEEVYKNCSKIPDRHRTPSGHEKDRSWMVANDRYKAAYDLFKQELANAVEALPHKEGRDIHSGEYVDVMATAKSFFQKFNTEPKDLIDAMNDAWEIHNSIFGPRYVNQARNFINFFQIVKEEFMKIGEKLPTMGDDEDEDLSRSPYMKSLDNEIAKYEKIEKDNF